MKQTSVQNLIINALLLVEAVLIVFFLLRMITKPRDKEAGPVVPDRELTIAEQEGEIPLLPIVGNSKPVDVEPVEGIRITAAENALDKDREFKITAVSDKDWDALEKKLSDVSEDQMLFCFDLDAGMEPDEHLPGEFTLSLDLAKMGIPPILHDKISVWRQAGDQMYQYTSWLQNGKLTFSSDQNCFVIFALPSGLALLKTVVGALVILGGATYAYETWEKHSATGDLYKNFFTMNKDAVKLDIKDSYGDFTVYFRFKDTEYADRFDTYKENCENFVRRGQELEEKAETEYGRQVEEKYNEERAEWTTWQKIMGSAEAKRKARAAIDKAAILAKLCEEDALLKRYAEGMQLPPSIRDLESMLKLANRYLTDDQGLRPQTSNLEVDLINTGPSGEYKHTATKQSYILINYPKMLSGGSSYVRKGNGENMLLTITHELFHHRQKNHNWPAKMDFRSEETTAAYQENDAALYYIRKGEITTNALQALVTGKFVGGEGFDPSPRENYELFGRDFSFSISTNPNWAYTYADFMDFLQQKKELKRAVKGGVIMDQYAYTSSHKANYMKWFGIKTDKEFDDCLQEFCEQSLGKIRDRQGSAQVAEDSPDLVTKSYAVSPLNPVVKIPVVRGSLIMRTFDVDGDIKGGAFNAFITLDKAPKSPDEISFYTSADYFKTDTQKGNYFSGEKKAYSGAYFLRTAGIRSFNVVALYAPDAPKIEKVKRDYVSFKLPKPESVLVKNKYITRALVTCTLKDGSERRILASADKFGKKVKWTIDGIGEKDFSLTVRWISEGENRPVYESPDSKPAVHGAIPPTPEASANVSKEKKKKEEKKQEKKEEPVSFANQGEHDSQDKMSVMDSDLPDIVIDKLSIVIDLPDSEADGHQFDHSRAQQVYSAQELKVTKEKDGYRVVGQSNHNTVLSTGHEGDSGYPGSTYEDHIDLVMDEDFVAKEGSFSWSWTYHDLHTSGPKSTTWYKQLSTLSARFIKDADFPSPYVTSSHVSQGYLMTTLSAAWKGQFGSYQRNFVLTTDDLKYSRKGSSNVELHYGFKEVK